MRLTTFLLIEIFLLVDGISKGKTSIQDKIHSSDSQTKGTF